MISNAEWEIMRVIWTKGQVTSKELTEVLFQHQGWSASTVKTLLARLLDKEVLSYQKQGRAFLYEARVSERELNQAELDKVLSRICQRKHAELLSKVLEDLPMTADQLADFQALLLNKKAQVVGQVPCDCLPGQCRCKEHLEVT